MEFESNILFIFLYDFNVINVNQGVALIRQLHLSRLFLDYFILEGGISFFENKIKKNFLIPPVN